MGNRLVVLVCGPPGAGKSSWCRRPHTPPAPDVYDIDDARWRHDEKLFRDAIARLARDPDARAYVIRSGARRSSRRHWARYIAATATVTIGADLTYDELARRIRHRNRTTGTSLTRQLAAARSWLDRYEPDTVDLDGPFVAADTLAPLADVDAPPPATTSERRTATPPPLRSVCVPGTPRTTPNPMPEMSDSPRARPNGAQ